MVARHLLALLAPLALGCSTLGTLNGARPLDPGQRELKAALSLQSGGNALSTATGLPMPQVELAYRRGLAPDLDWGARLYLFGNALDLRYRFARLGPFDLAVDPSLGFFVLPVPSLVLGNLDLGLPLVAEADLGRHSSVVLCARTVARESFARVDDPELGRGAAGRFELLAGGGLRVARRFRRVELGLWTDLMANTSRLGPPLWSGGADLGLRLGRGAAAEPAAPDPG